MPTSNLTEKDSVSQEFDETVEAIDAVAFAPTTYKADECCDKAELDISSNITITDEEGVSKSASYLLLGALFEKLGAGKLSLEEIQNQYEEDSDSTFICNVRNV